MRAPCRDHCVQTDRPLSFVSPGLLPALASVWLRAGWRASWGPWCATLVAFAFVVVTDFEGGGDGDGVLRGSEDASDAGIVRDDGDGHDGDGDDDDDDGGARAAAGRGRAGDNASPPAQAAWEDQHVAAVG